MRWRHNYSPDVDRQAFLGGLSAGEKAFVLVDDFFNRVHWSGFHQYFAGETMRDGSDVLAALELFGFPEAAAFLTRALRLVVGSDSRGSRTPDSGQTLPKDDEAVAREFGLLDKEFIAAHKDIGYDARIVEYVMLHLEEFQ